MNKFDIEKFTNEMKELENKKPVLIEIHPLVVFSIIIQIQIGSHYPIKESNITEIAINAGHKLQEIFDPNSSINKVLEIGWNPENLPI